MIEFVELVDGRLAPAAVAAAAVRTPVAVVGDSFAFLVLLLTFACSSDCLPYNPMRTDRVG